MVINTDRLRIVTFTAKYLNKKNVEWLNDPEVVRYSEQRHKSHSLGSCRKYMETFKDTPNYYFAILLSGSYEKSYW